MELWDDQVEVHHAIYCKLAILSYLTIDSEYHLSIHSPLATHIERRNTFDRRMLHTEKNTQIISQDHLLFFY